MVVWNLTASTRIVLLHFIATKDTSYLLKVPMVQYAHRQDTGFHVHPCVRVNIIVSLSLRSLIEDYFHVDQISGNINVT